MCRGGSGLLVKVAISGSGQRRQHVGHARGGIHDLGP
jgi:hypothetical protein